ncbi:para-aminobenzoate synthase [Fulvitalea axinellae]|uniref:Para-aminobenzoate synthase n=1 Tax=Fulvitalea axinellae TaxID=1182444 RepID=A0AAU9CI57_9BACT|nr:para-aminobenzoate synthase [Fulvitalea axinellae]
MDKARKKQHFDTSLDIRQLLSWANGYAHVAYLNPNSIDYPHGPFPHLLAVGANDIITSGTSPFFEKTKSGIENSKEWWFGYFGYDLKNEIENLYSQNPSFIDFPEGMFFCPETLITFTENGLEISSFRAPKEIFEEIKKTTATAEKELSCGVLLPRFSKKEYLETVKKLQDHIVEGDIYEINLCQEFTATGNVQNPVNFYLKLNEKSPAPFSAWLKIGKKHLLCASPERFIKKKGDKLISQPIKGTIRRGEDDKEDQELKSLLFNDPKERAENLMIVDLVRNDLARSSVYGSVVPEEIFGIYGFRQVNQMISTVTSQLRPGFSPIEAIRNAFPMGSMTGAPKIRMMELAEHYEKSKRGLYSGAVGFFDPEMDFDFNVVIRSIFLDEKSGRLSFQVGGAITIDSIPEKEYEECMLKASAILSVLGISN